jgi:hypothetical protein
VLRELRCLQPARAAARMPPEPSLMEMLEDDEGIPPATDTPLASGSEGQDDDEDDGEGADDEEVEDEGGDQDADDVDEDLFAELDAELGEGDEGEEGDEGQQDQAEPGRCLKPTACNGVALWNLKNLLEVPNSQRLVQQASPMSGACSYMLPTCRYSERRRGLAAGARGAIAGGHTRHSPAHCHARGLSAGLRLRRQDRRGRH